MATVAEFDIAEILGPATPIIRVAAVGAMFIGRGAEPHDRLIEKGLCTVVGFEPNRAECERLNAMHGPRHRYLPVVIGDGRRRTFHIARAPMTSSLYPPNDAVVGRFQELPELMGVETTEEVATVRLDDIAEVGHVDLIKVDVQGGELDVFRGAPSVLASAVVVHTEVSFVPLYDGQPLFGDVDATLRGAGFLFHRFDGAPQGRAFRPLAAADPHATLSQELWADAIYVRDFTRLDRLESRQRLALAAILHECYRSFDLCAYTLHVEDQATGSDLWAPYLTRLVGAPPPLRLDG